METNDYHAFLESILTDDSFTIEEKIEAEVELHNYYECLNDIQNDLENDNLSDEQKDCAYQEYLELTGSVPVTA